MRIWKYWWNIYDHDILLRVLDRITLRKKHRFFFYESHYEIMHGLLTALLHRESWLGESSTNEVALSLRRRQMPTIKATSLITMRLQLNLTSFDEGQKKFFSGSRAKGQNVLHCDFEFLLKGLQGTGFESTWVNLSQPDLSQRKALN